MIPMIRLSKLSILVGLSALLADPAFASTVVHPDALVILKKGEDCRSSCTARHGDDAPFALSFDSYEEGYNMFINLRIDGREFRGLIIDRPFIENGSLPFRKYRFPRHTLYGLISSMSTKNMEVHYFIRSDGIFSYLGEFPNLKYDTESGLFIGFFHHGMARSSTYYYRLQEGRLLREYDL